MHTAGINRPAAIADLDLADFDAAARAKRLGQVRFHAHEFQSQPAYQVQHPIQMRLIVDLTDQGSLLVTRFQVQPVEGGLEAVCRASPDCNPVSGRFQVASFSDPPETTESTGIRRRWSGSNACGRRSCPAADREQESRSAARMTLSALSTAFGPLSCRSPACRSWGPVLPVKMGPTRYHVGSLSGWPMDMAPWSGSFDIDMDCS